MKALAILGSTGSIGTSTLDIVAKNPEKFKVLGLAAGKNLELLKKQIREFKPQSVSVSKKEDADILRSWSKTQKDLPPMKFTFGTEGACEVACTDGVNMVVAGMVGAAGLLPTFEALKKGIDVALANKETMVVAGALMTEVAKKSGAKILPVDSEHNALFQAMEGHDPTSIRRLILTASGGPFRAKTLEELKYVSAAEALKHPNWDMGAKITIDSATMMNKGLEVIEAHFLFGMPTEKIQILVHPQSVVHSMVEYHDGSVIAQLGIPDMRIPISYALSYPARLMNNLPSLDLSSLQKLEFFSPDTVRFPAIALAYEALRCGSTMPTVLNAANEVAIPHFLEGTIRFLQIVETVEKIMELHEKDGFKARELSLETLLEVDQWTRSTTQRWIENVSQRAN